MLCLLCLVTPVTKPQPDRYCGVFLLTHNMLYEKVKYFQSNNLNLIIVRSFGAAFPYPKPNDFLCSMSKGFHICSIEVELNGVLTI